MVTCRSHQFKGHHRAGLHVPVERKSVLRQRARTAELDDLRLSRPLTKAEQAEADRLAHCLYMRVYRQRRAELGTPVS